MRPKATLQTVLEAIGQLSQMGNTSPSIDSVVEIVGGSKSTVARIMREHAADIQELRDAAAGLPSDLRDRFRQQEAIVWAAAEREARIRPVEETQRQEKTLTALHSHLEQQLELNAHLATTVTGLQAQLVESNRILADTEARYRELETSVPDLQKKLAAAEAALEARTDLLAQMRSLNLVVASGSQDLPASNHGTAAAEDRVSSESGQAVSNQSEVKSNRNVHRSEAPIGGEIEDSREASLETNAPPSSPGVPDVSCGTQIDLEEAIRDARAPVSEDRNTVQKHTLGMALSRSSITSSDKQMPRPAPKLPSFILENMARKDITKPPEKP